MYRISPSKLDQYRIYRDEVFDMSKEDLIERLTGEFEKTEAMIFGNDVHSFIETGNTGGLMNEEIEQLDPYRIKWDEKAKEMWATLDLFPDAYALMRVDMMHGVAVEDIKVSGRYFGVDYYEQSVQWKMYLMAMYSPIFNYHIFQKHGTKRPYRLSYHTFSFYAYSGMEDEIKGLAKELIQFCENEGITDAITDKKQDKKPKHSKLQKI